MRRIDHAAVELERSLSGIGFEGIYDRLRTYLCHVTGGEARPGIEPEVDTLEHTAIREVGWFDLRAPTTWNALVRGDPITMPLLRQLRAALGYVTDEA